MFIDTHAHLSFKDFTDIDDVVKRSLENGVEKIICVSSNIADSNASIELAKKYEGTIFASVGIHPQCTDPKPGLSEIKKDFQDFIIPKINDSLISNF